MRVAVGVFAALTCAALAPARVLADPPVRDGWSLGFGLGTASVSWVWPDDARRDEWSANGNLRVNWAIRNDCLIGLEMWGWSKSYSIEATPQNVPAETIVWAATPAITYFPADVGLFVRGGIGVGQGRLSVSEVPSVESPPSGETNDSGLALLGAAGYEKQLTPHLALGGAAYIVYIALDQASLDNVRGLGLTVQFNWYW